MCLIRESNGFSYSTEGRRVKGAWGWESCCRDCCYGGSRHCEAVPQLLPLADHSRCPGQQSVLPDEPTKAVSQEKHHIWSGKISDITACKMNQMSEYGCGSLGHSKYYSPPPPASPQLEVGGPIILTLMSQFHSHQFMTGTKWHSHCWSRFMTSAARNYGSKEYSNIRILLFS